MIIFIEDYVYIPCCTVEIAYKSHIGTPKIDTYIPTLISCYILSYTLESVSEKLSLIAEQFSYAKPSAFDI